MPATPREAITAALAPHLPSSWKLVPYADNLDALEGTVCMFQTVRMTRNAAAPNAQIDLTYNVFVITAHQDNDRANADVDDSMLALLHALTAARIPWSDAEQGPFSDSTPHLAWRFTVQFPTQREAN